MPRGAVTPVSPLERRVAAILRGRLAEQRRKHAEMADAIGVSRNHMSRMLNSRIHINVDQLAAMAEFVGMRPVEIVGQAERERDALAALSDDLDDQVTTVQGIPDKKRVIESEPDVG